VREDVLSFRKAFFGFLMNNLLGVFDAARVAVVFCLVSAV
jgi:hypothetical protein